LKEGNQSQTPRGKGWLTFSWKQGGELLVLKNRTDFIPNFKVNIIPFGKGGTSNLGSLFRG
jgi:hypothetical protein